MPAGGSRRSRNAGAPEALQADAAAPSRPPRHVAAPANMDDVLTVMRALFEGGVRGVLAALPLSADTNDERAALQAVAKLARRKGNARALSVCHDEQTKARSGRRRGATWKAVAEGFVAGQVAAEADRALAAHVAPQKGPQGKTNNYARLGRLTALLSEEHWVRPRHRADALLPCTATRALRVPPCRQPCTAPAPHAGDPAHHWPCRRERRLRWTPLPRGLAARTSTSRAASCGAATRSG
jgi:hypothetical protein